MSAPTTPTSPDDGLSEANAVLAALIATGEARIRAIVREEIAVARGCEPSDKPAGEDEAEPEAAPFDEDAYVEKAAQRMANRYRLYERIGLREREIRAEMNAATPARDHQPRPAADTGSLCDAFVAAGGVGRVMDRLAEQVRPSEPGDGLAAAREAGRKARKLKERVDAIAAEAVALEAGLSETRKADLAGYPLSGATATWAGTGRQGPDGALPFTFLTHNGGKMTLRLQPRAVVTVFETMLEMLQHGDPVFGAASLAYVRGAVDAMQGSKSSADPSAQAAAEGEPEPAPFDEDAYVEKVAQRMANRYRLYERIGLREREIRAEMNAATPTRDHRPRRERG